MVFKVGKVCIGLYIEHIQPHRRKYSCDPMKPSADLYDLIKSLTKSEKRFFKLVSSLQQGEKNYLKVFEFIDKQSKYSEEDLKQHFEGMGFIKHLPSEKNHLYKLLMKSLRQYHADTTVSGLLKQELKNIEILYKKALYRECNRFLIKAKKMAVDYEKFYYLFELLSWEKTLLEEAYESGEFTKDIDALIKEEQEVIEKLRNLAAYHVLYSKINYVFRSGGYVRNEADRALVEEISHHPLIIGRNTALSYRSATICYYIQGFCAKANLDKQTAMVKFMRVKEILDDHPHICKDLSQRYTRTLSNILSLQIDMGMIDEAKTMIQTMRDMLLKPSFGTEDIAVLTFRATYLAEIKICERTGAYKTALLLADTIIKSLEGDNARINKEHELHFLNSIASVYFGAEMYKESLQWINRVLNDNENHLRQDVYSYARLFNLVLHFELGNLDLMEYSIKSTYRYLAKRQRDHQLEVTILQYMKRLAKYRSSSHKKTIFREFAAALDECLQTESNRIVLTHFNYPAWINSKIEDITFAEAARRQYEVKLNA